MYRSSLWILGIALILLAAGCGGSHSTSTQATVYPAGSKTDEDIDRELKFDARVEDYQADGSKLVVNVNSSFASSPPGIQQRAVAHWYGLWQAARTPENSKPQKGLEVVVRHDGADFAKWTGEEGYKPVVRAKAESDEEGDSDSE
jgi:hypothetical protein